MDRINMSSILAILMIATALSRATPMDETMNYLRKYQYIGEDAVDPNMKVAEIKDGQKFHNALREFQRIAGLPETGEPDEQTLQMMKKPRCGMPDVTPLHARMSGRFKRYALLGSRWKKNDVTYRIMTYSRKLTQRDTEYWLRKAFDTWSAVTPLKFHQIYHGEADIQILFGSYHHGDVYPFDGLGNTLAHAFTAGEGIAGDAHFDESERWVTRRRDGTDLFTVAVHELGHSLGLSHSNVPGSIMRPFYQYIYNVNYVLHADDIAGIQYLYGPGSGRGIPTQKPADPFEPETPSPPVNRPTAIPTTTITTTTKRPVPEFCKRQVHFDAIVTTVSGRTFAFEGWQHVYVWNSFTLERDNPKQTPRVFKDLHWGVDTAFAIKEKDREVIYVFKAWFVWMYDAQTLQPIRSQVPLQQIFPELPNYLDAAFRWAHDNRLYFFKGSEYWMMENPSQGVFKVARGYPRSLTDWNIPVRSVNAVMSWSMNGRTYFFSGKNYFKYNDYYMKVEPGYPRDLNIWWLRCPDVPRGLNIGSDLDAVEGLNGGVSITTADRTSWILLSVAAIFFLRWRWWLI